MVFHRFLVASASVLTLSVFVASGVPAFAANPEATAQEAFQALQSGQYERAVALYGEAVGSRELVPEVLANALLNKALALQHLQKHSAAIAEYTAALELDAMSVQLRATVLYNRGLSYHKLRDLPPAIEDYTSALLLHPTMAHAFLSRGNALRDSGQLLFALSDYERALQHGHPDAARVHFATALTFDLLRRPKDAVRSLELALQINPGHTAARKKLEEVALKSGTDTRVDGIVTGSISAMGNTTIQKPNQAMPIEPKPVLMNEPALAESSGVAPASVTQSGVVARAKKIQDRLPEETADTLAVVAVAGPETKPLAEEVAASSATTAPVAEVKVSEPSQAVDPAALTGWAVQFASASSEDGAWSTWGKMQSRHKVLRDVTPVVVRADLGAKGIFYRVRLAGFESQALAKSTCQKMKRGGADCYVSKAGI